MAPLELFVLSWGVYPRRVLLYLNEKGLKDSPLIKITNVTITKDGMVADGKPQGTVPILKLPDGAFIKQSVAILEYLEDICDHPDPSQPWQMQLSKEATIGSMRGETFEERARTRDMLALADEASSQFGFACHKGSALFKDLEETSPVAAKLALEYCKKNLAKLESYYGDRPVLTVDDRITIADCVLYSLMQFSRELYGLDLLSHPDLPSLKLFYESFKKRPSALTAKDHFPSYYLEVSPQWLPLQ